MPHFPSHQSLIPDILIPEILSPIQGGKMLTTRIEEIREEIKELKKRMPAHSVPPSMFQELDELEVELAQELEKAKHKEKNA